MGQVCTLFPKFYYHGEVESHAYLKQLFLAELREAQLSQPSEWNCTLQSSFESNTNDTDFSWDVFKRAIEPNLTEMHEELGGKHQASIKMLESWINVYMKGDSQEVHTHCGGSNPTFSCAYFMQYDPKVDAKFIFYDPSQEKHLGNFSGHYPCLNTWFPDVKEGDIIIFPSYIQHQVDVQREQSERITISANFKTTA